MTTEPTVPGSIPLVTITLLDGTTRVFDEQSFANAAKAGFEPGTKLKLPDGREFKRGPDGSWAETDGPEVLRLRGDGPRGLNRKERRRDAALKRRKR